MSSDQKPKYVGFELVGGPHDGQVHFCGPGVWTIAIPHGNQIFQYVRQSDNRLHFKPTEPVKPKEPN